MKLRYKLFFIVYGIVLLTAGIGGFILTVGAADAALAACTDNALTANAYAAQVFLTLCARSGETPQSAARQLSALTGTQRGQVLTVCSAEDTDALLHGAAGYADTLLSLDNAQQCSFTAGSRFTAVTRADTGGHAFFCVQIQILRRCTRSRTSCFASTQSPYCARRSSARRC